MAEVPAGTQKQVTRDNWIRRQDVIDYTDDLTMLPSFKLRNQGLSQRRGSQNQHAIEEQAALHDSIGRGPDEQQQTSRGEKTGDDGSCGKLSLREQHIQKEPCKDYSGAERSGQAGQKLRKAADSSEIIEVVVVEGHAAAERQREGLCRPVRHLDRADRRKVCPHDRRRVDRREDRAHLDEQEDEHHSFWFPVWTGLSEKSCPGRP